ncbi:MAG: lysophospholipid acyltransferase family protein [Rhodoluna sp.]
MSERSKPSIFWLLGAIALPLMGLMVKYRFHDREKMPQTGAVIITPNHYSNIDPVVIGVATWYLGRLPRFMAKASILRVPIVGWILRKSGQIPVERGGSTRSSDALMAAKELVTKERALIVYPEGSLTRDPDIWPMRGKSGAVRLALELGIPVVPVAHWGTQNLMARYSKKLNVFPRHTVDVKVGDPVDLSEFTGKPLDNKTLTAATTKVMDAITALLEDLRGEKAPATRWNPAEHNQSETGRF